MNRRRKYATGVGLALLVVTALPMGPQPVDAADHRDGMAATDDPLADIADLYAWHTDSGTIVVVLTFNGLQMAGGDPTFDANVLYTINIDNTGVQANKASGMAADNDNLPDHQIYVRFGENGNGDWGVQVENLPGSDGTFSGPIEMELAGGGSTRAYAGVFEDPFFFDLEGFNMTRDNLLDDADPADAAFLNTRDFFAATNVNAIVLEMDAATAVNKNADNWIQIWATAGRAPK